MVSNAFVFDLVSVVSSLRNYWMLVEDWNLQKDTCKSLFEMTSDVMATSAGEAVTCAQLVVEINITPRLSFWEHSVWAWGMAPLCRVGAHFQWFHGDACRSDLMSHEGYVIGCG